jgi:hypothetical protein
MKKIIFTIAMLAVYLISANAQLKVFADGNVSVGNTSVVPLSDFQINSKPGGDIDAQLRFKAPNTAALFNYFDAGTDGLSSQWNVDLTPAKSNGFGTLGYFRSTNTTGPVGFLIFRANNTQTINSYMGANTHSYFNIAAGNFGIGNNSPTHKLDVSGAAYKTVGGDLWNMPSDRRLKDNVADFKDGLQIISQLHPVTYTYNGRAGTMKGEKQIGVIAQELQKIAPFMVSSVTWQERDVNEHGEVTIKSEEEILTINASALKWIIVNAINEQQKQIKDQEKRIEAKNVEIQDLQARIDKLETVLENLTNSLQSKISGSEVGLLGQNRPNPFSGTTFIDYIVPSNISKAQLVIRSADGKLLKAIDINHSGIGKLELDAHNIPSGTYSYQLIADGQPIDTKQMISIK